MPVAPTCSPYDPRVKCVGRDDVCRRGEFVYSFRAGGWVWRAFGDELVKYEAWLSCPFCGATLPTADMVYQRIHDACYGPEDGDAE
jgi:hypothetical protein